MYNITTINLYNKAVQYNCAIQLYNSLVLPALLYGSENWTTEARDARRITAAEVKCMRKTAGYIWTDCKTNTKFTEEPNITQVLDKIQDFRKKPDMACKQNSS
jgi:hypothetical protein